MLEDWLRAAEEEVQRQAQLVDIAQRDLARAEERRELIDRLLRLEFGKRGHAAESASGSTTHEAIPADWTIQLEDAVEALLAEAGEPLHIAQIRSELIARKVAIPGRGDDANIIVRLRRYEGRFTRTSRGTYALASWGLPALRTTRRKPQAKRASKR